MAHTWEQHAKRIDAPQALDDLAARAAHASIVLIGEASHGTRDFYAMRADLTRRLVADHGFRAVTLEADWPDAFRAHRYVTGRSDDRDGATALRGPLLQRAIGVIYRPDSERASHYFHARLPDQFDAMIHLDRTVALTPLERTADWEEAELPETWPTAL